MIIKENQKIFCALSGEEININRDNYLYFPNIVVNTKSPLYKLNDSFILKDSIDNSPLKKDIFKYIESVQPRLDNKYVDYISGEILTLRNFDHPENIIEVAYLMLSETHPCHKYNNILINKKNRDKWKNKNQFIKDLSELSESNEWGGDYIENLFDNIFNKPIVPPFNKKMLDIIQKKIEEGKGQWWMRFDE